MNGVIGQVMRATEPYRGIVSVESLEVIEQFHERLVLEKRGEIEPTSERIEELLLAFQSDNNSDRDMHIGMRVAYEARDILLEFGGGDHETKSNFPMERALLAAKIGRLIVEGDFYRKKMLKHRQNELVDASLPYSPKIVMGHAALCADLHFPGKPKQFGKHMTWYPELARYHKRQAESN